MSSPDARSLVDIAELAGLDQDPVCSLEDVNKLGYRVDADRMDWQLGGNVVIRFLRWVPVYWTGALLLALTLGSMSLYGASTDVEMANRYLRAAEDGDPTSQVYVAALYSAGVGFQQSDRDAFRWFLRAAEQGHSQAQVVVAALYAIGKGIPKDNKNAYRWAYTAAAAGDPSIRTSAYQLINVLTARMSADGPAEAMKAVPQPEMAARATTDDQTTRKFDPPHVAVRPDLSDADAYYRRGLARAQRREYALAIEDFGKVIELNPTGAEAFNNRCWLRAVVGRLWEALADCDQALRLRPNYADALESRGLVSLKLGELDQAISDFSGALRLNPGLVSAAFGRGKARLRKGIISAGDADIEAARAFNPKIDEEFSRYGVE
jgi:Flp pilus assembly protein TadD